MEKIAVGVLNAINTGLGKKKKTIICTVSRKSGKRHFLTTNIVTSCYINDNEIQFNSKIFLNENITDHNNKITFYSRKLKKTSLVEKCYSRDAEVPIVTKDG